MKRRMFLGDHAKLTSHLAAWPRGAGTRACRVPTHRDARRTCTQARPDESGRGRVRVRATSAHTPVTQGTKLHPRWYDNVDVWSARSEERREGHVCRYR